MATSQGIISGAMTTSQPDYTAQAQDLYEKAFGRAGDAGGVTYWAGQLASGKSAGQVQSDFNTAADSHYQQYAANPTAYDAANKDANGNPLSDYFKNDPGAQQAMDAQAKAKQGGIMPSSMQPNAATYNATTLNDTTKWSVTPEQTAAGLINQYTDPNSPIIQSAMTRAKEQQNANGTLNSSMAETAGAKAAYDAAIPLATQDAQTYSKAAGYNADEANQFAVQNATFKNQAGQFNAGQQNTLTGQKLASDTQLATTKMSTDAQLATAQLGADTQKFVSSLNAQTQKEVAGMDNASKLALAQLDSGTKLQLQQLDGQNKQLLQTNASAANMFSTYMQQIANITGSTTMDQAAKATAIQNAITNLNQGLQLFKDIGGIDLSKYFNPASFVPASPPAQPAAQTASADNTTALNDR